MTYNNYSDSDPLNSSTRFVNNIMQGYLKKQSNEDKLFKKLYHKRFVIIDFNRATLIFKYRDSDAMSEETNREVQLGHIESVISMNEHCSALKIKSSTFTYPF